MEARSPSHVAIIMDGNGRWAEERHLPRAAGHREGTMRVKEIVRASGELGIKVLTLFAFSTENWSRPKKEVDMLMRYFDSFLDREVAGLHKNNVKFTVIGRGRPLPDHLLDKIRSAEQKTKKNTGLVLVLAVNYGARQELIDAVKKMCAQFESGDLDFSDLDEQKFNDYLYTRGLPDPDLLIRTSGEQRISNFLLWQLSYTELYFTRTYWPDFHRRDLELAVKEYRRRQRRFGGAEETVKQTR
ncbi:MAG: isoprenyl transferase [Candidatus Omnitrophica bacterium]|nr:isoprenyl transferase [Candidatus Omnitrophota bacterium]